MNIKLHHGGGAKETRELINNIFLKHLKNEFLSKEDATVLNISNKIAITTDSFTVNPIFFKGGNIGKLSVAGIVNDLSVMGAKPLYITMGFILEEGLSFKELEDIVISIKNEADKTGIKLIAGDTKVVPKNTADKIYINATGIGELIKEGLSSSNLQEEDVLIVSGPIGNHGAVIMAHRNEFDIDLESDCASLWELVESVLTSNAKVHAMRDLTRGGLATTLHEFAENSSVEILVEEEKIPVEDAVIGLCEILGIEYYSLACEGRILISVAREDADMVLNLLKNSKLGKDASIIGKVLRKGKKGVYIKSQYGGIRYLEEAPGEVLPRIC